ncbi:hypothetical protein SAMN05216389_11291 [Oceanobacillus limi]|uniref:Uncharacterized protein n=1 Tax=Oceanobacillus limi TaxID=930131 RepID=A0A1I0EUR5_9BACI|nr:hypothetical protein SAMN05216389_11291 [Oceanobacillus limi]
MESGETQLAVASKLTAIGIMALSLAIGFLSFYLLSDLTKEKRKRHIEELTSQFINFVIFIWLGKIVLHLPIFISDPLSILTYPSDSQSFYFAIVLISLLLLYKTKRKKLNILPFLESFIHIFLVGSFVYEFIQFVVEDNPYAFGYLILLAVLIGMFFFLQERLTTMMIVMVMMIVWSVGLVVLGFVQPFVTVFGYIMAPWFVGLFFVLSMGTLL